MSSTGRGERLGGEDDFFPTPAWCVDRLLEAWQPAPGPILEPGAGDGAIIRAAAGVLGVRREWHAAEIREEGEEPLRDAMKAYGSLKSTVTIGDFLKAEPKPEWKRCVACLGNPPFCLAEEFIHRCRLVAPNSEIVMLLRLNFLGSDERAEWLQKDMASSWVLPNRPIFRLSPKTGKPQTDSCEYAWLIWGPTPRAYGVSRVLKTTPLEIRRAQYPKSLNLLAA